MIKTIDRRLVEKAYDAALSVLRQDPNFSEQDAIVLGVVRTSGKDYGEGYSLVRNLKDTRGLVTHVSMVDDRRTNIKRVPERLYTSA